MLMLGATIWLIKRKTGRAEPDRLQWKCRNENL